jgi:uncharacterized protein involved in exopolysaccharide biosynthesis
MVEAEDTGARKEDDEKEIDLREYLGIILEGWPWILAFAVVGLIIAAYLG